MNPEQENNPAPQEEAATQEQPAAEQQEISNENVGSLSDVAGIQTPEPETSEDTPADSTTEAA